MKFSDRKKEPPLTVLGLLLELLAHGMAIVLFAIGSFYALTTGSVVPFVAGLGVAGLMFWAVERFGKFLERGRSD